MSPDSGEIFSESDIILLYQEKCNELELKWMQAQFIRFKECISKMCVHRKCNLSQMHFGHLFAMKLCHYLNTDRISELNLSNNLLGDKGAEVLSHTITYTKCLISLNLASNDFSA